MSINIPQISLDESKELIIESYRKTYDKFLAYEKCGLSKEEIKFLEEDKYFQERLSFHKAQQKEDIISKLKELMNTAEKEDTQLKAVIKLGEILYPEAFVQIEDKKTELILPLETQKRLKDIFASGSLEAWKEAIKEKMLSPEETKERIIEKIIN